MSDPRMSEEEQAARVYLQAANDPDISMEQLRVMLRAAVVDLMWFIQQRAKRDNPASPIPPDWARHIKP